MSVDLYIGPLIARDGSFGYDTFSRLTDCAARFAIGA